MMAWLKRLFGREHTFELPKGNDAEGGAWAEDVAKAAALESRWGWTDWLPLAWAVENRPDRDAEFGAAREAAEMLGPGQVARLVEMNDSW